MMRRMFGTAVLLAVVVGCNVKLPLPETEPGRTLDPEMHSVEAVSDSSAAVTVRLLETRARPHIRHRILHRADNGELVGDAIWSWSSPPHRYLDTALAVQAASDSNIRIADKSDAPSLAATLIACHLEPSGGGHRIVAAVELAVTDGDRIVRTEIVGAEEPFTGEMPGNLAAAMGNLMQRLATQCLAFAGG